MTKSQKISLAVLILLLVSGIVVYFFVIWPSWDFQNNITSFVTFIATLIGFSVTIYQLGETERSIRESIQKPALEIDILSESEKPGSYSSTKTHELNLQPLSNPFPNLVGTSCAIRITNSGERTASRIYFTFIFRRKGNPTSDNARLNVSYNEKAQILKPAYYSYDVRKGLCHRIGHKPVAIRVKMTFFAVIEAASGSMCLKKRNKVYNRDIKPVNDSKNYLTVIFPSDTCQEVCFFSLVSREIDEDQSAVPLIYFIPSSLHNP